MMLFLVPGTSSTLFSSGWVLIEKLPLNLNSPAKLGADSSVSPLKPQYPRFPRISTCIMLGITPSRFLGNAPSVTGWSGLEKQTIMVICMKSVDHICYVCWFSVSSSLNQVKETVMNTQPCLAF